MLHFKNTYSSYSVNDVPKAKDFYSNILGVTATVQGGYAELQVGNNYRVVLYPKPNHEPATFTVLNFSVPDIEKAVDELTARGVRFEQYEGEIKTDERGICRNRWGAMAWFKDPAGNILGLMEEKS